VNLLHSHLIGFRKDCSTYLLKNNPVYSVIHILQPSTAAAGYKQYKQDSIPHYSLVIFRFCPELILTHYLERGHPYETTSKNPGRRTWLSRSTRPTMAYWRGLELPPIKSDITPLLKKRASRRWVKRENELTQKPMADAMGMGSIRFGPEAPLSGKLCRSLSSC